MKLTLLFTAAIDKKDEISAEAEDGLNASMCMRCLSARKMKSSCKLLLRKRACPEQHCKISSLPGFFGELDNFQRCLVDNQLFSACSQQDVLLVGRPVEARRANLHS
jgi:hypothetical protein